MPSKSLPNVAATCLRILHLENSEDDRELVRQAMDHEDVVCEFSYAASGAEFSAALERKDIDLILSDFSIPGYDCVAALALARKKCPDVPYLFVSGAIGEEHAIASLKSGATDYVLKNRLDRLLPAVRRALHEVGERSKRNLADEALRRSEERLREMAERIEDVFYSTELDTGRWLYVSPAYEKIWGRPLAALYERPAQWTAAVVPEDREMVLAARERLTRGEEFRIEYRIRRPDGELRWIEDRGYVVREPSGAIRRAVGVAMDLTPRRHLEGQLRQAKKMEEVGQLAGGLAHDFNNVLTIVIGYARLLLDRETMPKDAISPLTQIFNAGTRAANLVRQLLVFSRKQIVSRVVVDLNQVAGEISEMLGRVIGEHISLELALSPTPCTAEADAGMMEQVLMNLAVNARDSMPGGGTLVIATQNVTIVDAASRHHPGARPGAFVCLSVRDTGCGTAPAHLQRIFEPFFTTKKVGEGTGLGLAMVFGIVQQHRGWVEVESALGVGTTFRILLPSLPQGAFLPAGRQSRTASASGGSETILIVEDEPAVREFAVAVLAGHGYRVLQAGTGIEALEVWKWHGSRIALLVTDLVLPDGLGGAELADKLRKERPALKVVLTSGYASEVIAEEFRPPTGTHFIQKPYGPQMLARAVRDALDDNFNR